jgi:hypothetical protein
MKTEAIKKRIHAGLVRSLLGHLGMSRSGLVRSIIFSAALWMGSCLPSAAQEVLVPAPVTRIAEKTLKSTTIDFIRDTLELPFFEDFSKPGGLPNPEFWTDRLAYVNNTYTRDPVTFGVATMDAMDASGNLNGTSRLPFESDFLTSNPINLDYPGRQDIWLSFFYGRWGLGDPPEENDSLVVEFLEPDSSRWITVWSTPGFTSSVPEPEDTFRQVFIPVNEDRFLKKGFRFRFKNYASMGGGAGSEDKQSNADHWNIDYIYLDKARSSNVTALNDVSMISSIESLLKSYESIPWRHFPRAYLTELKPSIGIAYRNNDTTLRNVTRILKITDLKYQETDSTNGGAANVAPGRLNTFLFPYNYPFIFYEADSTVFEIKSYLVTEELDYKQNDTVVRYQKFYNYYAYDDGSAENGYGLRGEGTASASIACQFKTFKTDTLRAVNIYFNRTVGDYSQDYFYLAVWDHDQDLNAPGELLHTMSGVKPEYLGELNRFKTYYLDTTIVVSDRFYVGWIKTTERMLNVGWDAWNNNRDKVFYNLGQGWVNTKFNGSLMIRPLMGKELSWPATVKPVSQISLRVYPNPATERVHLDFPPGEDPREWTVEIFNLQGQRVCLSQTGQSSLDIGNLPEGLYILRGSKNGIYRTSNKIMIVR